MCLIQPSDYRGPRSCGDLFRHRHIWIQVCDPNRRLRGHDLPWVTAISPLGLVKSTVCPRQQLLDRRHLPGIGGYADGDSHTHNCAARKLDRSLHGSTNMLRKKARESPGRTNRDNRSATFRKTSSPPTGIPGRDFPTAWMCVPRRRFQPRTSRDWRCPRVRMQVPRR